MQTEHPLSHLPKITVSSGTADQIRIEPSLNGARVTGWVNAENREMAFCAAKEVASKFDRSSIGAWIDAKPGEEVMAPFEFEVGREYVSRSNRPENFEETKARIEAMISK